MAEKPQPDMYRNSLDILDGVSLAVAYSKGAWVSGKAAINGCSNQAKVESDALDLVVLSQSANTQVVDAALPAKPHCGTPHSRIEPIR